MALSQLTETLGVTCHSCWAAAGLLHPVAAAQWRADPRSHAWWDHACRRLRQAQPVPADTIVEAMWIAAGEREPLLLQRLQHAARDHPPPALVDLAWCLRHCSHDDGYIPAPAQEMCLQIYGGLTMSSELDRFTNGYRTREQAHPHPTDIPPPEPDSEPERSQTALPLLPRWQCHDKPGKASTAYPSKTSSRHRCPPYRRCRFFWWNQSKKP